MGGVEEARAICIIVFVISEGELLIYETLGAV
jgi:hypothetical protein